MVAITAYTSLAQQPLTSRAAETTSHDEALNTDTNTDTASTLGSTSTVSNLARQLSEAASRAEVRNASLSRKELGQKASALIDQVIGDSYQAHKAQHDAEVPDTDDPKLLARAEQATQFSNGSGTNPFKGLSRDQLALIAYDESGSFTVNERRAAWIEAYDQEEAWRQKVVAKAMDEYNRTGKLTNFFTEVLAHYKELPAIEQAQYPADYASQLQSMIDRDFNYMTHQSEGQGGLFGFMEQWLTDELMPHQSPLQAKTD